MSAFNIDSKEVTYLPIEEEANQRPVIPINIPHDFMAGRNIFPSRVLAGYNQPVTSDIAFGALMRSRALANPQATAYYWCMGKQSADDITRRHLSQPRGFHPLIANNSGSTGGRYFFGYLFMGGPLTREDFVEGPVSANVTAASAFK
jgi:hypothetical protein